MNAPFDAPVIGGRPEYPGGVRGMLRVDLFVCAIEAVLVLFCLLGLWFGVDEADIPMPVLLPEMAALSGIALFGILADVALLRYQPKGAAFAKVALVFVGLGMAVGLHELWGGLTDPGPDACPPDTLLLGGLVGLFIRVMFNVVWFDMVRRAQRHLRGVSSSVVVG